MRQASVLGIAPIVRPPLCVVPCPGRASVTTLATHREEPRWPPKASPYPEPRVLAGCMDKGLKKGAIGYLSNIVIGVASTAPAYSLAATLGFIVAVKGVGVHAPAVLLVAFIPMLLVAVGLQILQPRRPRRGHDVRLGHAHVRAGDRLAERLGDLPRGRDRDGLAGGHRGDLHVQAVRLHRTRRIESRRSSSPRSCGSRS